MGLSMAARKAVTKEMALRYRKVSKANKGVILDELCALAGWHRDYARRALRSVAAQPKSRGQGKRRTPPPRKPRPPLYDDQVIGVVRFIWLLLDFPCGKRLKAVMGEMIDALERHGELDLDLETRAKLSAMSASTIDRRLSADRRRFQLKGRSSTKPGTLLKGQIPIRTFTEWDNATVGFTQVRLSHES